MAKADACGACGKPPAPPPVCPDCGQPTGAATTDATMVVQLRALHLLEQQYRVMLTACAVSWVVLAGFVVVKAEWRWSVADLIVLLGTTVVGVPWTHQRLMDARHTAQAQAEYDERRNTQYVDQSGNMQPAPTGPVFTPQRGEPGVDAWAENEPDRDE